MTTHLSKATIPSMHHNSLFKDPKQEARLISGRILAGGIIIVLLLVMLIGRLAYIQIAKHSLYTTLSKQNRIEVRPIEPTRGLIFDRNGVLLAKNIPVYSLDVIPNQIDNLDEAIERIKTFIPLSENELSRFHKSLTQHRRFETVTLKLKLTPEQVAHFSTHRYDYPGFMVNARLIREYPERDDAVNVVGYVGRINADELSTIDEANYSASNYIGKTGVEKYYESLLHGQVGYQKVEVNASGEVVRTLERIPPLPGNNLYLTIDVHLQQAAEKALGDKKGAVIALDPRNGEILALISNPPFNPNLFVQGIDSDTYQKLQNDEAKPLFDRALRGLYPPGSTIKPFLALEGLDSGTTTPDYKIFDPGYFRLNPRSRVFHDWNRRGHGWVDVHSALAESCDTYFFWLANRMGIKKIDAILEEFGFGKPTGIDLPTDRQGLIPSPQWKRDKQGYPWYRGDTLNTSIGQGFMLVTPLQLVSATGTLAMHGIRYQPHVLLKQKAPHKPAIENTMAPEKVVTLAHPDAWDIVIQGMQGVIQDGNGTGFRFGRDATYSVAGKTGTAQVYSSDHYRFTQDDIPVNLRDNDLFIAFAPVEDPRIAIMILAEHTSHTAPVVARKMMDDYLLEKGKSHVASS